MAKSGNNALQKACALLGYDLPINHIAYPLKPEGERFLFIARHPKNILISGVRAERGCATPTGVLRAIPRGFLNLPISDAPTEYGAWIGDADTTVIRFEDLIASDAGMRAVAAWLGVDYNGTFDQLQVADSTPTWHFPHSDWTKLWNADIQAAWEAAGGPAMEAAYGY